LKESSNYPLKAFTSLNFTFELDSFNPFFDLPSEVNNRKYLIFMLSFFFALKRATGNILSLNKLGSFIGLDI